MKQTKQIEQKKIMVGSLSIKLPIYLAAFCIILSFANALIGYRVFKSLFEKQYKNVTEQFAFTALSYINGDKIEYYASNPVEDEEWKETDRMLEELTENAYLAYIYVTIPDVNYESRIYIYDTVHSEVENGKKYELGKVNSLKKYTPERIEELKQVMIQGIPTIHFVYNNTGGHVTTSIPVKDSNGNNVAILSIVKPMSEVKEFKQSYRNAVLISSALITALFVFIFIFMLIFRVVRPLSLITNETAHFAEHGGKISGGVLSKIRGSDELAVLARSIEKMGIDMNKYIEDLTHTTAEKERLSAELDVATQIQANMLPRIFPPYHNHPELELFATMSPAKEVGGDFYDFFMIDEDRIAIVIADVSGKGMPAALFTMITKIILGSEAKRDLPVAEVMRRANDQLCANNPETLFVTVWLGIYYVKEKTIRYVNAGHDFPALYRESEGRFTIVKEQNDLPMGVIEGTEFTEQILVLEPKDKLFLYTDGIPEANDPNGEMYGEERMLSALDRSAGHTQEAFFEAFNEDVFGFIGEAEQFDDMTMLLLEWK